LLEFFLLRADKLSENLTRVWGGCMISKHVPVVFLATMLGILAVSGAEPEDAGAAITDEVNSTEVSTADVRDCTGGNVSLSTDEKRMLDLHNKTRVARGLPKF
jgi:hypothetical protein